MTIPNNANEYLPGTIQIPSSLVIVGITQAYPMVVSYIINTVTASNTYIVGQLVRLTVPYSYGMFQANGLVGKIIDTSNFVFKLDIDSSQFDAFTLPSGNVQQPASLAPAGSRNLEFSNNTDQVPFQSLNNKGN